MPSPDSQDTMDPRFRGDGEKKGATPAEAVRQRRIRLRRRVQRSPEISPALHSVESLRTSIPQEYQTLFERLRKEVIDFCDLHHIPTSSLNNDKALREATKHLSNSDLEQLSLLLSRLDYLVRHKEPMPEERVSLTEEQAREIMGENMLGTREVEEHFGELSDEQQEALSIIPFSRETLEACRETHILVADIGISLLDMQEIMSSKKKRIFREFYWSEDEVFTKRVETTSWRLIRKTPVKNSPDRTWDEQQILINKDIDEIPSTRQIVYAIILKFLATKERLLENFYVRTSDAVLNKQHVFVGFFREENGYLYVYHWADDIPFHTLGVASARKPEDYLFPEMI